VRGRKRKDGNEKEKVEKKKFGGVVLMIALGGEKQNKKVALLNKSKRGLNQKRTWLRGEKEGLFRGKKGKLLSGRGTLPGTKKREQKVKGRSGAKGGGNRGQNREQINISG